MNNKKISPDILCDFSVSTLSTKDNKSIIVSSNKFYTTKSFLDKYKFNYTPYQFAKVFCMKADRDDINILSCQDDVNYIYPNPKVKIENYCHEKNNFNLLTENKYFGQGQTICFIDTGISTNFDLIFPYSRIIKFIDLINKKETPYDDNGHGTFVTGIACGSGIFDKKNIGFAPLSNIISIKALNEQGNSNSDIILDAMQWIYENQKIYNISVVCMSFGADIINTNDPLSQGAQALWKRGIVVVAAAGNSGPNKNTIKSPGNNPYIITVGALDEKSLTPAEFSSRGPTIYGHKPDLLASGVDIKSCSNFIPPYTNMSGTSVATPIVAGICAVIKSRYPKMTNNEIKQYLIAHCKKITGNIDVEGAGYLDFQSF